VDWDGLISLRDRPTSETHSLILRYDAIPLIHCLPIFVKHSHFLLSDVISKRITFSQPFPPPSDPPANAPSFFFKISALYKSFTYLLTYLLIELKWILKYFIRCRLSRLTSQPRYGEMQCIELTLSTPPTDR